MAAPSTTQVLSQWNWDPTIVLGLIAVSGAYAYAIGPMRRQRRLGPPLGRKPVTYFVLAMLSVAFALMSPIDYIGDEYLFTVHMIQHLVLATVFPPLLLIALPAWLVRPVFSQRTLGGVARFLTHPVVAITLFNADVYAWHVPPFYDATLQNEGIHVVEHLSFMACGVLTWWPVLSPIRAQRISYPMQIFYLFAEGTFMMILGVVFTFSPFPFYSPYIAAPRLWGFSALNDQQVGGLVMWYPGNFSYFYVLCIAFYRWFDDQSVLDDRSPTSEEPIPYNEAPRPSQTGAGAR